MRRDQGSELQPSAFSIRAQSIFGQIIQLHVYITPAMLIDMDQMS
jgi:hypothetical protein